jgi:Tol biopolymer transport system component
LRRILFVTILAAAAFSAGCEDSFTGYYAGTPISDRLEVRLPPHGTNGGKIYFISNYPGSRQLFEMNEDGSGIRQITSDPGKPIWEASISKDETWMIVESVAETTSCEPIYALYNVNLSTGAINLFFNPSNDIGGYEQYLHHPVISPDNRSVAFSMYADLGLIGIANIFVVDQDGKEFREVTNNLLLNYVSDWSNDGLSLFGSTLGTDTVSNFSVLASFDLAGNVVQSWGNKDYEYARGVYSHSGKSIAFQSYKHGGTNHDIVVLDLDSNSYSTVSKDHSVYNYYSPVGWSPDDRSILCYAVPAVIWLGGYPRILKLAVSTGRAADVTPAFSSDTIYCWPAAWTRGNQREQRK